MGDPSPGFSVLKSSLVFRLLWFWVQWWSDFYWLILLCFPKIYGASCQDLGSAETESDVSVVIPPSCPEGSPHVLLIQSPKNYARWCYPRLIESETEAYRNENKSLTKLLFYFLDPESLFLSFCFPTFCPRLKTHPPEDAHRRGSGLASIPYLQDLIRTSLGLPKERRV